MTIGTRIGNISPFLSVIDNGSVSIVACSGCGEELGLKENSWKDVAVRKEVPLAVAGGPAYDTGDSSVVLRHFYCPGCAMLLDTETARPQDPPLDDRL